MNHALKLAVLLALTSLNGQASEPAAPNGEDRIQALANQGNVAYEKKDYAAARRYFEQAAAAGNEQAQLNLGVIYEKGQGVSVDYAKARQLFEQAAAGGNERAQFNLGVLYDQGRGVPQDFTKARQWYAKAANHPKAQANLAALYLKGQGGPQDLEKGVQLLQKAADAGIAEAQVNLGIIYRRTDPAVAREWFKKAASQTEEPTTKAQAEKFLQALDTKP